MTSASDLLLPRLEGDTYEELRAGFALEVPDRFNLAASCVDRHPQNAPALIAVGGDAAFGAIPLVTLPGWRAPLPAPFANWVS